MILEEEGESWSFAGDGGVPGLGKADRGPRGELNAFCSRVWAGWAPWVALVSWVRVVTGEGCVQVPG